MAGDPKYLAWVRSQPCCACGRRPPSEAHHKTGAGLALKAHDHDTMPLCAGCHRAFHDASGRFAVMNKAERKSWQMDRVQETRARFEK